jgi:hypothetical protein
MGKNPHWTADFRMLAILDGSSHTHHGRERAGHMRCSHNR